MARFTHPNDADIAGPAGPRGEKGDTGAQGPQGEPGAAGGFGKYGSWYHTETQTVNVTSIGQPVILNTEAFANGFTKINNSELKCSSTGIYNLAFSFQFRNEGGGGNGTTVEIWLVKNEQPVANTNTRVSVNTNSPFVVSAWNFFEQMEVNDNLQIYWATDNHHIVMKANTGTMGGPHIPSAIMTINQVG